MKSPQHQINQQQYVIEALHRAGRAALIVLAIAAVLVIASTMLTAALTLPETLYNQPRW